MKLCVMRGQMHAKTPTGLRCKIIFPGDPEYTAGGGIPLLCTGCVVIDGGRASCTRVQCCTSSTRNDGRSGGVWLPVLPS